MKIPNKGKKIGSSDDDSSYSGNVVIFPKKKRKPDLKKEDIADPGLSITTEGGHALDKLGMSGDECCYILPPHVSFIRLTAEARSPGIDADRAETEHRVPVRVILSESAAVTEIGMDADEAHSIGGSGANDKSETHWVEFGRTLYLARRAPEHVAMLSVRFANRKLPSR